MNLARREPKRAACSSNLAMVCCWKGAIRALPSTKKLRAAMLAIVGKGNVRQRRVQNKTRR